jgi:hypothetical protein
VQVAPGDLDVAIFGKVAAAELALSDALETCPPEVIGFEVPLTGRPAR